MIELYDVVSQLTGEWLNPRLSTLLQDFSMSSGWHPSYSRTTKNIVAKTHLLVEHELQNPAVISLQCSSFN